MNNNLVKQIWSEESYYKTAAEGSMDTTHPAMKKLAGLAKNSAKILDMGCGEGTRLNQLIGKNQEGFGIDISGKAIEIAKKKYPQLHFEVGNLEELPYGDEKFDLVYSAYVFEHLDNPEKVVKEGIRVLKTGGTFLIVAPNFGAPNRASPSFRGNRLTKLLSGFIKDLFPGKIFSWNKVTPIAGAGKYDIDWDTTIEPYLGSLIRLFKRNKFKILYKSSVWEEEQTPGTAQKIFGLLGRAGIYPFKYWGPHMLVIATKI